MQLSQSKILEVIRNSKDQFQSNDIARFLILKKAESFVRDILTMKLEKECAQSPESIVTAVHEYKKNNIPNKHDISILKAEHKRKYYHYQPTTIIELKFTKASWIILNEQTPITNISIVQDSIWRENMKKDKNKLNKETGIIFDLKKMVETQNKFTDVAIHHIIALVNPHKILDDKYTHIIEALREMNACLLKHNENHTLVRQNAHSILHKQLKAVENAAFPSLNNKRFILGMESITVGEAFNSLIDLDFVVISEQN